ncbi:hypothetical protein IJI55_00925 [Candidatus Saccharibacteria bacterium]|nr:hypothetical protein [Candidatus Saccharibacteria bacterium]
MDELTFLEEQVSELNDKNLQLKSEVSYLKGKIEAYEWFLRRQGFIKGGEE